MRRASDVLSARLFVEICAALSPHPEPWGRSGHLGEASLPGSGVSYAECNCEIFLSLRPHVGSGFKEVECIRGRDIPEHVGRTKLAAGGGAENQPAIAGVAVRQKRIAEDQPQVIQVRLEVL